MEDRRCQACGEPVEERFRLCPFCGAVLSGAGASSGGPLELVREVVGLDERTLPSLIQLFRDPGRIAAAAASPSSQARFTRPVRLYLMVSFVAIAIYAFLGWALNPRPTVPQTVGPNEMSLELNLSGPNVLVGDSVLAAMEAAGGVDPWLAQEGRLDRQSPWMRFFLRRALHLKYEGRFDDVRSGFAQNKGLISLFLIPLLSVILSVLYFRRAAFRGHFDLAAVLVALALLLDLVRQVAWIGFSAVFRFLAGIGMPPQAALTGYVLLGLGLAQALAFLWYVNRSTRSFYGLGTLHAMVLAPLTSVLALLGYVVVAFAMNVAFILMG
jgi:hypothetical protein